MLEDGFGRRFYYLRLSVTEVCNYRCNYCLPDGYQGRKNGFLDSGEVATLAAAFARLGTEKIRLTGGEPSLRRDLPELIHQCSATPGIRKVALTTNGYRLEERVEDWMDAGLDALNVSVDSLDPDLFRTITGHDRLHAVLSGIDRALSAGLKNVKINAVMMRRFNHGQLHDFLEWLRERPVTLRWIELMRTGDNPAFFRENHVPGEEVLTEMLRRGWEEIPREYHAGPARELCHPDYAGRIGFIMPYSKDFCDSCNRLRVSSTGKLHLCLFGDDGNDVRQYCREGDVDGLAARLQQLVTGKRAAHRLHDANPGGTRNLAMIGG